MSKKNKTPPAYNGISVFKVKFVDPEKQKQPIAVDDHAELEAYAATRNYNESFKDWQRRIRQEDVL